MRWVFETGVYEEQAGVEGTRPLSQLDFGQSRGITDCVG
jgi:hypothetical protein